MNLHEERLKASIVIGVWFCFQEKGEKESILKWIKLAWGNKHWPIGHLPILIVLGKASILFGNIASMPSKMNCTVARLKFWENLKRNFSPVDSFGWRFCSANVHHFVCDKIGTNFL